jgi:hypothetical protein
MHEEVEVGDEAAALESAAALEPAAALEAAGGALHEAAHSTVAVTVAAAASQLRANESSPVRATDTDRRIIRMLHFVSES